MAEFVMPGGFNLRRDDEGQLLPITPKTYYDSGSDTLFIFFYGKPGPSISVDSTDTMYAMLDPETMELIGIQTESFTRTYVPRHPWLKPFVDTLTNSAESSYEHEQDEHRDLASYFVGSLMTEGSLATS